MTGPSRSAKVGERTFAGTRERLGRLLGRDAIFAGRAAQLDRAYAISAARWLGDSMRQIGEAERRGEGQFRDNVTAQMRSRRT